MNYEHYFATLAKANQDSPEAFLQALGVVIQMERDRKAYEEDMNQLEKQKQESWRHQLDQDDQAIEDFCNG